MRASWRPPGKSSPPCSGTTRFKPTRFGDSLARPNRLFQLIEAANLGWVDPNSCFAHFKEFGSINFRKILHTPRMRRPFHLKGVALHRAQIAIALKGPDLYSFASLLPDRCQCCEIALRCKTEFFGKLAPGCC